jgi:hypothetical protein
VIVKQLIWVVKQFVQELLAAHTHEPESVPDRRSNDATSSMPDERMKPSQTKPPKPTIDQRRRAVRIVLSDHTRPCKTGVDCTQPLFRKHYFHL